MKNKIEFNQESIKRFFIHHWEKMAFGIGIISIGLFAYFGMNSESYNKITPAQLDNKIGQANNYMADSKWDDIAAQRVADTNAPDRITQSINNKVDNSDFVFAQFMGTALKTQTLRADPILLLPKDFDVRYVVTQAPYRSANAVLNRLPLRNPQAGPGSTSGDRGGDRGGDKGGDKGGDGGKIGGGDGAVGSEGLGGSNASAGGQAIGGAGGGRGAGGAAGSGLSNTLPAELIRIYHSPRPNDLNLNISSDGPVPLNLICVTALVPVKDQMQKYKDLFENSVGYNEQRDVPLYTYIEVQMKEDDAEWTDVTEVVTRRIRERLIGKGPEPVKKEYINKALTQPIPALLGTDYRQLVCHPALENHVWYDPSDKISKDSSDTDVKATDVFSSGDKSAKVVDTGEKEEKKDPEYFLLRFFYPIAKAGSTYQFRVRLWLADPNNPGLSKVDVSSVVSGGRAGGMGGDGALSNGPGQSQSAGQAGIEGEKDGGIGGDRGRGRGSASENVTPDMLDPKVRNRLSAEADEWKKKKAEMQKDAKSAATTADVGDRDRDRDRDGSARGNAKLIDEEQLMKLKMVSRHTDWSEPTPAVTIGTSQPSYYAGDVKADTDRVNDSEYHDGETTGSLVVKTRIGEVAVDGAAERKTVYPGDGLNWKSIWTIIHPIDLSIRHYYENASDQSTAAKEEEKEGKVVTTDSVLIDIMGGEEVRNLRTREKEYMLPGQFLIMDDNGNFTVADEVSDQGKYRLALAKVNLEEKAKVKKTDDDNKDDRGLLTGGGGKR